jgi:thymidylate synthase (FAD)
MDKYFQTQTLSQSSRPQWLCALAMHNDYSEEFVCDESYWINLSEEGAGRKIVENCLKFGHWGILEHPSITFAVGGFPHEVMGQARTHRVGVSFDVQSQRYTSQRVIDVAIGKRHIESVFYFRAPGDYCDREGNKYEYTESMREWDIFECSKLVQWYKKNLDLGHAPEHARGLLPQNIRQNFVVSFNARSLLHFLDLRMPADAQLETRWLAEQFWQHFKKWMPAVAEHYEKTRLGKNKLAP